eukprot:12110789-Alexandrium_andersonii.AAC.1
MVWARIQLGFKRVSIGVQWGTAAEPGLNLGFNRKSIGAQWGTAAEPGLNWDSIGNQSGLNRDC